MTRIWRQADKEHKKQDLKMRRQMNLCILVYWFVCLSVCVCVSLCVCVFVCLFLSLSLSLSRLSILRQQWQRSFKCILFLWFIIFCVWSSKILNTDKRRHLSTVCSTRLGHGRKFPTAELCLLFAMLQLRNSQHRGHKLNVYQNPVMSITSRCTRRTFFFF